MDVQIAGEKHTHTATKNGESTMKAGARSRAVASAAEIVTGEARYCKL